VTQFSTGRRSRRAGRDDVRPRARRYGDGGCASLRPSRVLASAHFLRAASRKRSMAGRHYASWTLKRSGVASARASFRFVAMPAWTKFLTSCVRPFSGVASRSGGRSRASHQSRRGDEALLEITAGGIEVSSHCTAMTVSRTPTSAGAINVLRQFTLCCGNASLGAFRRGPAALKFPGRSIGASLGVSEVPRASE
jgi:hypothetical protein